MRALCTDSPEARGCLLHGGHQRYRFGKIQVVPLAEGLMEPREMLA